MVKIIHLNSVHTFTKNFLEDHSNTVFLYAFPKNTSSHYWYIQLDCPLHSI